MKIAIDFDGTCVKHDYPNVGPDIGAVKVLKELVEKGHQLILYTMRCGQRQQDAINWFFIRDIKLFGIQFDPEQTKWNWSNKCYAHLYIDDLNLGTPTKIDEGENERPYIDWVKAREMLVEKGIL